MKTNNIYQKQKTERLQYLLLKFERLQEKNELLIDELSLKEKNIDELKKISNDFEIDISLIRMELNKRLWNDDI